MTIELSVEVRQGLVRVLVGSSALWNIGAAVLTLDLLLHLGVHHHAHRLAGLNLLRQVVVMSLLALRGYYV